MMRRIEEYGAILQGPFIFFYKIWTTVSEPPVSVPLLSLNLRT